MQDGIFLASEFGKWKGSAQRGSSEFREWKKMNNKKHGFEPHSGTTNNTPTCSKKFNRTTPAIKIYTLYI